MIAIKVAESLIMRLVTCPGDEVLADKEAQRTFVTIEASNPQTGHDEFFEITNLHHESDCWGVDHLTGLILADNGFVPVTFLNNEAEASILNLR